MKAYVPMPREAIDNGPMTEPCLFEAHFDSTCRGCGGPIATGERIWGVKVNATKKWVVWHDKPSCAAAVETKGFVRGAAAKGSADPVWPRGMSQHELELLKLFEDEPR